MSKIEKTDNAPDTQQAQDALNNATLTNTSKEKALTIALQVITAYKDVIMINEPSFEKLSREMTRCYVTASTIVRRLNSRK